MNIFVVFGKMWLREIPERFLWAEEWIFPGEGLIPCRFLSRVPLFCIFAGRFHHFRLFNFFCLCLIFRYLCNIFKNGEFIFSLFLLIKCSFLHWILRLPCVAYTGISLFITHWRIIFYKNTQPLEL